MEILVGIAVAIAGMIWAFFRGKQSERSRGRQEEIDGIDGQVTDVEGELEAVEDQLTDNQARDLTPDEAIRILRERYGWGANSVDDHAP